MTSIQGNNLNKFFQDKKTGGLSNNDFKSLVNEAKKDGKIDVDEAKVLIDAAFEDGSVSTDDEKNAMTEIGKNINGKQYEQLKGLSSRLRNAEQNPVAGNISFLIKEGMRSKDGEVKIKNLNLQQSKNEEGTARSISRTIGELPGVGSLWNEIQGNDKDGNTQEQIQNAVKKGTDFAARVINNAKAVYSTQTEADRGDCVAGALKKIQPKGENWNLSSIKDGVTVTTDKLKELTMGKICTQFKLKTSLRLKALPRSNGQLQRP